MGVGLRPAHYREIHARAEQGEALGVDLYELLSENFLVSGGRPIHHLERALELSPCVPHGVSLSIGSSDPLDRSFLAELRAFARKTRAPWLSDHLCWSGVGGAHMHELFPLPLRSETARYVAARARIVQDTLEARFALENVSSYASLCESTMDEASFVAEVLELADVGLLLDVNNVYVSAHNHGFDPLEYLDRLPLERVVQIHLAGHTAMDGYLLDTHGRPVSGEVWALYERVLERAGMVTTILEWDEALPSYAELVAEAQRARAIRERVAARRGELDQAPGATSSASRRREPAPELLASDGEPAPPEALARLQAEVQELCRARGSLEGDAELAARAEAIVGRGPRLDGPAQLDIYRRQYWLRHEEALAEDHPSLRRVLGDEAFHALMHDFFAWRAPRRRSLRDVAEGLEDFLPAWPGLDPAVATLAADTLSYELVLVELFDARDVPALDAGALAGCPPEELTEAKLGISPLLRRLSLRHRVWHGAERPGDEPSERREAGSGPVELVVCRQGFALSTEELSGAQAALLDALAEGATIAEACARVAEGLEPEQLGRLGAELGRWLEGWTRAGYFSKLSVPGEEARS